MGKQVSECRALGLPPFAALGLPGLPFAALPPALPPVPAPRAPARLVKVRLRLRGRLRLRVRG